jgi:hypothetical protein
LPLDRVALRGRPYPCLPARLASTAAHRSCRRTSGGLAPRGSTHLCLIHAPISAESKRNRFPHLTYGMRRSATSRRTWRTVTPRCDATSPMSIRTGMFGPSFARWREAAPAFAEPPACVACAMTTQLLLTTPSPINRNRVGASVQRFSWSLSSDDSHRDDVSLTPRWTRPLLAGDKAAVGREASSGSPRVRVGPDGSG